MPLWEPPVSLRAPLPACSLRCMGPENLEAFLQSLVQVAYLASTAQPSPRSAFDTSMCCKVAALLLGRPLANLLSMQVHAYTYSHTLQRSHLLGSLAQHGIPPQEAWYLRVTLRKPNILRAAQWHTFLHFWLLDPYDLTIKPRRCRFFPGVT